MGNYISISELFREEGVIPEDMEILSKIFGERYNVTSEKKGTFKGVTWAKLFISYDEVLSIGLEKIETALAEKPLKSQEFQKIHWHLKEGIPARKCRFLNKAVSDCDDYQDSCCPGSRWDECPVSGWTISIENNCPKCSAEKVEQMKKISQEEKEAKECLKENSQKKAVATSSDELLEKLYREKEKIFEGIKKRSKILRDPFEKREEELRVVMKKVQEQKKNFWS
jgi:hypothetical protein